MSVLGWPEIFKQGLHLEAGKNATSLQQLAANLSKLANRTLSVEAVSRASRSHRDTFPDLGTPMQWLPHYGPIADAHRSAPSGYAVKGVSTLVDAEGNVKQQWIKTDREKEEQWAAMAAACERIAEPFKGAAPISKSPRKVAAELLCVYPMGDPHIGMYSWAAETGTDFDCEIAERNLVGAVDHLVDVAPAAENALIINLGDYFHADNATNRTARSGHVLDVDTRWPRVLGIGVRTMRRCIDRALEKHKRVTVWNLQGNHDDHSAMMLAICLQQYYERDKRVDIPVSPSLFHYARHGSVLLGSTHGHSVKMEALPLVMANDRKGDWGETDYHHWYTGHLHHDRLREFNGCTVETSRTLAGRDAWTAGAGYRSGRDMKCDVWHRTDGMINRHVIGVQQLTRAA